MGFLRPKTPPMPKLEDPPEPPSAEDEARRLQALEDERRRNRNRVGKRQTILTGTGLSEIESDNIDQKTLLGG
tara:strand:+ start:137 stop:355 length:219 start_codon:yes stop_codon:yes gene_type:complete